MGTRLELYDILKRYCSNVYYQPPTGFLMKYPCVIYAKTGKSKTFSNNGVYLSKQEYQLTVIDESPDSTIADRLDEDLEYCSINQYFTVDRLNHVTLNLYF